LEQVKTHSKGRVETFIGAYPNYHTRKNYWDALYDFFSSVYEAERFKKKGEKREWIKTKGEQYFGEDRDYKKDIDAFLVAFAKRPPKTIQLKLAALKMFLLENEIELPQKFWRRIRRRIKGSRALTLDKVPSNLELRKLIMHMPVQGKALFLLLSSSGMRIGEALQLKLSDVNVNLNPIRVEIRGEYTKTGNSRVAFTSRETKEALEEWFKLREQYIMSAHGKSHLYLKKKAEEDDRLFPFEDSTAYMIWRNALSRAEMSERDKNTNRRKLHPHVLRKFFRTRLGSVIPVDVVEALMGHEGYLTEVYRRYSMEDLAKFYLQGESALLVFTEAGEVTRLRQEVEESKEQLQTLVNTLATKSIRLEEENQDLRHRSQMTEKKLSEIEDTIADLKN